MKRQKKRLHSRVTAMVAVVVVAVAALGYATWFAYHSSQVADASLKSANKVSSDIPKLPQITTFAACKTAYGSKLLQTYPEQCVTATGKKFTDSPKYLVIKEWGVKIPLADADRIIYKLTGSQSLSLYLNSSVTAIGQCQNLGVGYVRDSKPGDFAYDLTDKQVVAGHTYALTGSPAHCNEGSGNQAGPINKLRTQIIQTELPATKIVSVN